MGAGRLCLMSGYRWVVLVVGAGAQGSAAAFYLGLATTGTVWCSGAMVTRPVRDPGLPRGSA